MPNTNGREITEAWNRQALVPLSILRGTAFALTFACCISSLFFVFGEFGGLQLAAYFVLSLFLSMALSPFLLKSFYDNIFFVVLVNSVFPAYCLALVLLEVEYFIAYCFPLMILMMIFTSRFAGDMKWNSYISLILFMLVVPSLFGSISSELVSIDRTIVYLMFSFLIPLFFFTGIHSNLNIHQVEHIICLSFMVLVVLSLIFIPVEILSRGSGSVRSSEVGGRSYTLVAILILIFPVLKDWLLKQSRFIFWVSCILLTLLIVFSFSRGVILFAVIASLPLILLKIFGKPSILFRSLIFGTPLLFLLFYIAKDLDLVNEILWFWSLRLNIFDNNTGSYTFEISKILADSSRLNMWENAVEWSSERFWFGYGVGSSAELIVPSTGARFGFGGMHNQTLTVLVERGVFGVFALLSLWVIYLWNLSKLKIAQGRLFYAYCFFLFLLYTNVVGIEILVVSTKDLNSNALSYLLMMLVLINLKVRKLS